MDLSDYELIENYRSQGTQACLDELVRRHIPRIRTFIFPMVGQGAIADDLTQETFFRAMRSLHTFQSKAQFGTWLAQVAINVVREHRRNCARRKTLSMANMEAIVTNGYQPDQPVQTAETVDDIQAALLELPEALREAVVLVCLQGRSTSEAAEICKCSMTTLYWRIHQSRKRLKQRLADYL